VSDPAGDDPQARTPTVADVVAATLAARGVRHAFGVVGSGNFHVTNALRTAGVDFVAARHETGAATMADACARISRRVTVVTLHQGCGLTNALTGLAEAAKSGTPMVVLAAEATNRHSNFFVDQAALAEAVGAVAMRVDHAGEAAAVTAAAHDDAMRRRRTVVLNLPLDVQADPVPDAAAVPGEMAPWPDRSPSADDVAALADELRRARRPVFVAGRGAREGRGGPALVALGEAAGALLATSAVAKGLFHDDSWAIGISGGFSSPLAADLVRGADLVVGWGCTLNMWTMRHGRLLAPDARVVQVDLDRAALGSQRAVDLGVVGGVVETAEAVGASLAAAPRDDDGYRDDATARRLAGGVRWRDHDVADLSTDDRIDPRTLTIALDDLLPRERIVGVDSGNFMGHPSMYLSVPDEDGFCFTQAFQSIGLGLATTIGCAVARPDRLPVATLGDGGALMGIAELETVARLGLPMVVVVYNDEAYGAEVHHFGPDGHDLDTVVFPPTDLASIARGHGFDACTVRTVADLDVVAAWVAGPRERPLLVDARVVSAPSWWLEEAFRGH
jgi:acetolactate synthase-1/2/3 large subunit